MWIGRCGQASNRQTVITEELDMLHILVISWGRIVNSDCSTEYWWWKYLPFYQENSWSECNSSCNKQ